MGIFYSQCPFLFFSKHSKHVFWIIKCIGGQAKTLMFVHISPEPDAVGETISTLKFAERVATVELGTAKVNRDVADVKDLKEQVFIFFTYIAVSRQIASKFLP